VHAKEKTKDASYVDKDKSNMQEDLSPTTPLRHLAFKKIHFGPIEVKVSF
jgi:hypothetical protein